MTPSIRIRSLNSHPLNPDGDYVLYWMIANRRATYNYALQRAVEFSEKLKKPLLVFEALRTNYRWASDRLHRFVMQGMADNRAAFENTTATYYANVEPEANHTKGLLEALAAKSCVVITDDFPCFFIPTMLKLVSRKLNVSLEAIDSNGIYPMYATDREFTTAYSFRRFLQKSLPPYLVQAPKANPLFNKSLPQLSGIPHEILKKWPEASDDVLRATPEHLATFPIDHQVQPACFDGGMNAAKVTLERFLKFRISRYAEERNDPEHESVSGLSPYLHFGHISVHEVFENVAKLENWSVNQLSQESKGARSGWWNMSPNAESFLDELITWREIGYNMCSHRDDYDNFESLPDFALQTLEKHASDQREFIYTLDVFEAARTHDELWNAAQRQLMQDGRMHNYLRMLWGKKILEWTEHPRDALKIMIELNNKYAVDGRNPNSYSGIFWTLGRYDRAWGPEREIFGKVRYMTSDSTRRKLNLKSYLEKYGAQSGRLF